MSRCAIAYLKKADPSYSKTFKKTALEKFKINVDDK